MRLLALLVVLASAAACSGGDPVESAISEGYADEWPRISQETLSGWASFPVGADPRPLVLLGEPVNAGEGAATPVDGPVDPDGKVPPEAAEAFAKLTKAATGTPKFKVMAAEKGSAEFATDRGPRDLPAWIFRLTGVQQPVAVLAVKPDYVTVKPDYENAQAKYGAKLAADGVTLTVRMPAAPVACGGEPTITYHPEWLESATAVAVGLKKRTGKVLQGNVGTCRRMPPSTAEYTVKLGKPLGNRVLVAANTDPLPVTVSA
ncbi:MAG TPA: hypothetical protein VF062_23210 [Candidatus Limnocylindrales bacterium]